MRGERVITIALPNEEGPSVFHFQLGISTASKYRLMAWQSKEGSSNVYLLDNSPSLERAQVEIAEAGTKSLPLLTVPASGVAEVDYDTDTQDMTVFFEGKNESRQTQTVTVKLVEC